MKTIESFRYAGRARTMTGQVVLLRRQLLMVVEYMPYEPANYVHEATWVVTDEKGREYEISAGDKDIFDGRCSDCQQKHDDGDCHYDVEPIDESDREPHIGHYSRLGGTYWCDTCDSPYCDQA